MRFSRRPVSLPAALDIGARNWSSFWSERSERAERWLWENLDDQQRRQFSEHRAFVVAGRRRRYVIDSYGRVTDDRGTSYCITPRGYPGSRYAHYPDEDRALAIMLLLRFRERKFRRIAHLLNRSIRQTPHPLVR